MKLPRRLRHGLEKILLGEDTLPLRFFIAQPQPQQEIQVWLHGVGQPRDVTRCHGPASTIPFTLWVAFDANETPDDKICERMSLQFREAGERERLLGRLGLRRTHTIAVGSSSILVFEARSASNYCRPQLRLFLHFLLQMWKQRHSKIKLSRLEHRAMSALFICPRPISLVSVAEPGRASMFPLNVMGDVNEDHFAFALTSSKIPARFLASARRFALSAIPIEQAPVAFALAANHNVPSIDFADLPFPTRPSSHLGLAVPTFALRVREMEIESVHQVGSHSLFVARVVSDERRSDGPEFSVVHGFYQMWRLRNGLDSADSIALDASIRAGTLTGQPLRSASGHASPALQQPATIR
jgi:flavin reductase (DIM6/NTAB) family NADH-FMN oxidoreductase RutF